MDITTIKLSRETKSRLDNLKEYRRETYDEILQKILNILNVCKINPDRARTNLAVIDRKRRKQSRVSKIKSPSTEHTSGITLR